MRFIQVSNIAEGAEPLRERLVSELGQGKDVLWLVPGGSNIPLSAAVMSQIPDDLTTKLTIMLTDERYGKVGHPDSNVVQLDQAGFKPKQANFIPVIDGTPLEETCQRYAANFTVAAGSADIIIGQFGMGADGHIAGCLPGSPAVDSGDLTAGYDAGQFTRVTLTPKAIQQVTAAFLFAFGDEKRPALENLRDRSVSLDEQPAQILKQVPDAYVYNDQIGDQA